MCDRCGVECGDEHRAELNVCYMSVSRRDTDRWIQKRDKEIDLCDGCVAGFDEFMDQKAKT